MWFDKREDKLRYLKSSDNGGDDDDDDETGRDTNDLKEKRAKVNKPNKMRHGKKSRQKKSILRMKLTHQNNEIAAKHFLI